MKPFRSQPRQRRETSGYLSVHGRRMFARRWPRSHERGGGVPDVVLVHGVGVSSRMCQPTGYALPRHYQVWAPDLPGFGRSDKDGVPDVNGHADRLVEWQRAAGISGTVLAGTSLGAQISAAAAQRHPEDVAAVVLGAPTIDVYLRSWRQQLSRWPLEQAKQSARMRVLQVGDVLQAGPVRVARTFGKALEDRLEDRLPMIRQPVLVCWGNRDPVVSRPWVERLASAAPRGRLTVLPGALHTLAHENPLEFARAIDHFVDTLRTG